MRLCFLGSPPFAPPVLARLLASRHVVAAVVTQPERPAGRGRAPRPSAVAELARAHGLPLLRPESTREPAFVESLRAFAPEVLLVASYGEILREPVLELAPHGALNVHASLLPRWRGASPIQHAIAAGDRESGVCVQRMVLALDRGDLLCETRTPIGPEETAGELLARLAELGGELALEALDRLERGAARFTPQDEARATWAPRLSKDSGRLDWTRPADELARWVRAMTPWPGARTTLAPDASHEPAVSGAPEDEPRSASAQGRELVLLRTRALAEEQLEPALAALAPGTLVASHARPFVRAGAGALELLELKPAGKRAMSGADFLRGAHLALPARMGSAGEDAGEDDAP